ncbi:MAG: hypothetical protein ACE5HV_00575 [Acidobacteriota bacterium]
MNGSRGGPQRRMSIRRRTICLVACLAAACSGFSPLSGGSLQLNTTDVQSRAISIHVRAGESSAQLLEIGAAQEVEVGQGTATIDRYLLQRVTFGQTLAAGLFLCKKPCTHPTADYLVAYSPDQLFAPDGELRLRFRVVHADGPSEEISRIINPEMLPQLWRQPLIEIGTFGDAF